MFLDELKQRLDPGEIIFMESIIDNKLFEYMVSEKMGFRPENDYSIHCRSAWWQKQAV